MLEKMVLSLGLDLLTIIAVIVIIAILADDDKTFFRILGVVCVFLAAWFLIGGW